MNSVCSGLIQILSIQYVNCHWRSKCFLLFEYGTWWRNSLWT